MTGDRDLVDVYLADLPPRHRPTGLFEKGRNVASDPLERNLWLICAALQSSEFFREDGDLVAAQSRLHVAMQALEARMDLVVGA